MIKLFASILISCPILVFGFYKSYIDTYRLKDLSELYKAFNMLKYEIEYSSKTLEDAFYSISTKVKYPIADIFNSISLGLKNERDLNIFEIFQNAIISNRHKTYLTDSDIQEFIEMSNTIGYLNNTSILSNIDIYLITLQKEIDEIGKNNKSTKKMYQSLSLMFSILLIIILL